MNKLLAVLHLLILPVGASASTLAIDGGVAINFSGYDGQPRMVTGAYSTGTKGQLKATVDGTLYATYLGQESGYLDRFKLELDPGLFLTERSALGATISQGVTAGLLDFKFQDSEHGWVTNEGESKKGASFAILAGKTINYGSINNTFDYILGFNDSARGSADFDDFVVGLRFEPARLQPVSAVPLPAAGWLFVSALAGLGLASRRRRT